MDAVISRGPEASPLEQGIVEGENPVLSGARVCTVRVRRVELLGSAAQSGW